MAKKKAVTGETAAADESEIAETDASPQYSEPIATPKKPTKVEDDDPDKPQKLTAAQKFMKSDAVKGLIKSLGEGVVSTAADARDITVKLPTGIFPFDYALGGGWPIGRIMHIYGRKSSSKTTTILRSYAKAQRACANCWRIFKEIPPAGAKASFCPCKDYREPVCGYMDAEGALDLEWAKTLGVDMDRLILSRPPVAEEGIDVADVWLRSGEMDLIAIDSVAFLVPLKEQEKDSGSLQPGEHARLVNKLVRKMVSGSLSIQRTTGRYPTVFLLNQIREKIGVMFGSPETTTGGNAPGFAATVEVKFSPKKVENDPESGVALWADIGFKIEKNKVAGTAKMDGEYKLILADSTSKKKGQVHDEPFVISKAQEHGLITGAGSSWHCLGEHFSAKSLIEKRMFTDTAFGDKLREETMKVLLFALTGVAPT